MFDRIRRYLVVWNLLVLGLILVVVGGTALLVLTRSLVGPVDAAIAHQSDEIVQDFRRHGSNALFLRPGPPGYRGGFFTLVLSSDGQVIANPQQVDLAPSDLPRTTVDDDSVFATIPVDGDVARVDVRSISVPGQKPITLVIGRSIAAETDVLNRLLLVFLGGGIFGLLLCLVGAWFLAGRALVPIRRAFERQREFVADASHELRTPLTVLRAGVDLLGQHRAEPLEANAELLDDIAMEIARLERLTGDLLTLARSDLGELGLALGDLDLGTFAAEVSRRFYPLARSRGIDLSWSVPSMPVPIEGDPDRLEQVLLILLDNAVKHSRPGGRVRVSVRPSGNAAILEVADEGEGIPPEHLPRVFERFYRADQARSRQEGSVGLGLAIARTFVEGHGGRIGIASKLGVGTTVTVSLPLRDQPVSLADRLGQLAGSRGNS